MKILCISTGQTLWESVAILLYLVHHYDKEKRLWFTNEDEIADANQWLLFQASGIGPYFGQKVTEKRGVILTSIAGLV